MCQNAGRLFVVEMLLTFRMMWCKHVITITAVIPHFSPIPQGYHRLLTIPMVLLMNFSQCYCGSTVFCTFLRHQINLIGLRNWINLDAWLTDYLIRPDLGLNRGPCQPTKHRAHRGVELTDVSPWVTISTIMLLSTAVSYTHLTLPTIYSV